VTVAARFRQADVTRVLRGARKAMRPEDALRLTVTPDGTITVLVERQEAANDTGAGNSWDDA